MKMIVVVSVLLAQILATTALLVSGDMRMLTDYSLYIVYMAMQTRMLMFLIQHPPTGGPPAVLADCVLPRMRAYNDSD